MTSWITAKHLALATALTARRMSQILAAHAIPTQKRPGRAGELEFSIDHLPQALRSPAQAWLTQQALQQAAQAFAPPPPMPLPQAAPLMPAPLLPAPPGPATPVAIPEPQRRPPSQEAKQIADARLVLIRALQDLSSTGPSLSAAAVQLAQQINQGYASAELQQWAAQANLRKREAACAPLSARTLLRWASQHAANGWWALLPREASPSAEVCPNTAIALSLYASKAPAHRNLTDCISQVASHQGLDHRAAQALYSRAKRALPKLNRVDLIKSRHSGGERAAKLPFVRRSTSELMPLDLWLIDGHTFKAKVRHPDHSRPFAPEVTVCIDAATRMICGWSVALSENTIAVGDALRHGVQHCGIPAIIYTDNGAGETGKQLDCPITGIIARLGAQHRTGRPGNPQGRGLIERSWQSHMLKAAKQFASYQGSQVDANSLRVISLEFQREARALKRAATDPSAPPIKLSNKAPSWAEFIQVVAQQVAHYNTQHRHRSLPKHASGPHQGLHCTPAEAWALQLNTELQIIPPLADTRMLFMPQVMRTAQRGEVTLHNNRYFSAELMQLDGQTVRVGFDIHNAAQVTIFDAQGNYICEAGFEANSKAYFDKPFVQLSREQRVQRATKRRQDQIDLAQAELNGQAFNGHVNPSFLPAPTDATVLRFTAPLSVSSPGASSVPAAAPNSSLSAHQALAPDQALPDRQDDSATAKSALGLGRPFFNTATDKYEWLLANPQAWQATDLPWVDAFCEADDYLCMQAYHQARGQDWASRRAEFAELAAPPELFKRAG